MENKILSSPNSVSGDEDSCNEILSERESRCTESKLRSQNPYSMVLHTLMRDLNLDPLARWLVMYLLSHKPGWVISVKQVRNHAKKWYGRDKVRSLFNAAIDAGYIKRKAVFIPLKRGGTLKRYDYEISDLPVFKKSFPCTANQGPGDQGADKTGHKNKQEERNTNLKKEQTPRARIDRGNVDNSPPGPATPSVESATPPVPSRKGKRNQVPKQTLPLFDPRNSYFKDVTPEEIELVKHLYGKQKKEPDNPIGWIVRCLEGKWHLVQTQKEHAAEQVAESEERKKLFKRPSFEERPSPNARTEKTLAEVFGNLGLGLEGSG